MRKIIETDGWNEGRCGEEKESSLICLWFGTWNAERKDRANMVGPVWGCRAFVNRAEKERNRTWNRNLTLWKWAPETGFKI